MNNIQLTLFEKEHKYVLLSLRETYFNDIKQGKKLYEFRKQYCKDATTAFIYQKL